MTATPKPSDAAIAQAFWELREQTSALTDTEHNSIYWRHKCEHLVLRRARTIDADQPQGVSTSVADSPRRKLTREVIDSAARFAIESDLLPTDDWEAAGLYDFAHAIVGGNFDRSVDDLSSLVRRLAHSLKKGGTNSVLAEQAVDYLQRHGLAGEPLRAEQPQGEPAEQPKCLSGLREAIERCSDEANRLGYVHGSVIDRAMLDALSTLGVLRKVGPKRWAVVKDEASRARAVLAASPAADAPKLWCLHIQGMDDIHAAPSYAHAKKAADDLNQRVNGVTETPLYAEVIEWPHSAESHAEDVGKFIEQWLVPAWAVKAAKQADTTPDQSSAVAPAVVPEGEEDAEAFACKLEQIAAERDRIMPGTLRETAAFIRQLASRQHGDHLVDANKKVPDNYIPVPREPTEEMKVAALKQVAPLPRAWGVARMSDNDNAVLVSFREAPTDDQLRYLHELLAGRALPAGVPEVSS